MWCTEYEGVTLEEVERAMGKKADEWHGLCYGVACVVADMFDDAVAVYGHYVGPVDANGFWGKRRNCPFQQHGWVLLGDGTLIDPTRFSFENVAPSFYVTTGDDADYDEGANEWREAMGPKAPPEFSDNRVESMGALPEDDGVRIKLTLLLGWDQVRFLDGEMFVTVEQLFWIANRRYEDLQPYARPIYDKIREKGYGGFIPLDNQKRAKREEGVACRS